MLFIYSILLYIRTQLHLHIVDLSRIFVVGIWLEYDFHTSTLSDWYGQTPLDVETLVYFFPFSLHCQRIVYT